LEYNDNIFKIQNRTAMNACSDKLVISSVGNVSITGVLSVSGGITGIITASIPSIDASHIFTHNACATQELHREIKSQKERIKELVTQKLNYRFM
jgi:hypothetical protein